MSYLMMFNVVAHEVMHLLEPFHNKRFKALMGEFLPEWEAYCHQLKADCERRMADGEWPLIL